MSYDGILMCIRQTKDVVIPDLEDIAVSDISVSQADLSEYMQLMA